LPYVTDKPPAFFAQLFASRDLPRVSFFAAAGPVRLALPPVFAQINDISPQIGVQMYAAASSPPRLYQPDEPPQPRAFTPSSPVATATEYRIRWLRMFSTWRSGRWAHVLQ